AEYSPPTPKDDQDTAARRGAKRGKKTAAASKAPGSPKTVRAKGGSTTASKSKTSKKPTVKA
ncbi:MAG: hypothetical protein ACP5M3_00600, partial [Acidithiobacillus sp.]